MAPGQCAQEWGGDDTLVSKAGVLQQAGNQFTQFTPFLAGSNPGSKLAFLNQLVELCLELKLQIFDACVVSVVMA